MSWVAKTLHVSPTGRAKPRGKTTRASLSVRKTKYAKGTGQDRPLPLSMACHPQPLTRTPLHPGCVTDKSHYGQVIDFAGLKWIDFMQGVGLHVQADDLWRVVLPISGRTLGWADSRTALAYRMAAARVGATLEVYDR